MYIDTEEIARYIMDRFGGEAYVYENIANIIAGDSEGYIEDIIDNVCNDIENISGRKIV